MTRRKVVNDYYIDINNIVVLLSQLINSYKLLISSADELNNIALSNKKHVKKAMERAEKLGCIIDKSMKILDSTSECYYDYCKIKSEIMNEKLKYDSIMIEISEEMKLK